MAIEDWIDFSYLDEDYDPDIRCKRCGKRDLIWMQGHYGTWFLLEESGQEHVCKPVSLNSFPITS